MPVITFKRMRQLCAPKSRPESEGEKQKRVGSASKKRKISFQISKKSTVQCTPVPRQKMLHSGHHAWSPGQKVKNFQCSDCCKMFTRKHNLKRHQRQQHENNGEIFSCVFCDKTFFEKHDFEDHLRSEINERSQVCRRCWKTYSSRSSLQYHKRTQHGIGGTRTYHCSHCSKVFTRKGSLKRHQEQQHENKERPFSCVFCEKEFFEKRQFEDHLRREINERSHVCRCCWNTYSSSSSLHYHKRTQHRIGGAKTFNCTRCPKSFITKDSLKIHEKREHELQQGHLLCVFCDKRYFQKDKLENHLRSHIFEKSVVCELCFKSYTSTRSLHFHRKIHAGQVQRQKLFCMFCSAVMTGKQCLENHLRVHVKEYPFTCKTCSKAYASHNGLWYHLHSQPGHLQQSHDKECIVNPSLNSISPSTQGSSKDHDAAESRESRECQDSGTNDRNNPPPPISVLASTKNARKLESKRRCFIPNFTSTASVCA